MTDAENNEYPTKNCISDAEWATRRLCRDGNCVGVIGPDGRCKECGLAGGEDLSPFEDVAYDSPTSGADGNEPPQTEPAPAVNDEEADAADWKDRHLCPDGNCIGVIGLDGRCKECGRPDEDR